MWRSNYQPRAGTGRGRRSPLSRRALSRCPPLPWTHSRSRTLAPGHVPCVVRSSAAITKACTFFSACKLLRVSVPVLVDRLPWETASAGRPEGSSMASLFTTELHTGAHSVRSSLSFHGTLVSVVTRSTAGRARADALEGEKKKKIPQQLAATLVMWVPAGLRPNVGAAMANRAAVAEAARSILHYIHARRTNPDEGRCKTICNRPI
jgi:hypothetical protein